MSNTIFHNHIPSIEQFSELPFIKFLRFDPAYEIKKRDQLSIKSTKV